MIHIQKEYGSYFLSLQSFLSRKFLKNNLLPAHTWFCAGREIEDHITHSKANSVEKKYPHTPPAALHIHYRTHSLHMQTRFQSVLGLW